MMESKVINQRLAWLLSPLMNWLSFSNSCLRQSVLGLRHLLVDNLRLRSVGLDQAGAEL